MSLPKFNSHTGIAAYFFILIFGLFSCRGGKGDCKSYCIQNDLDENCCPKIDTPNKISPRSSIKRVNIFIETSGSMAGYMPNSEPATDFQRIIPDLLASLNPDVPNSVKFYSIYNSNTAFRPLTIDVATSKILHGNFDWSGSTYLPIMLDSVNRYLNDETVNVFISDCIYSPELRDKKKTELTATEIREKVKFCSDTFASSIFCFFSDFRQLNVNSKKSPYYLIVQGKPDNTHRIEDLLKKSLKRNNQKYEEVTFGGKYNQPYYSILPYTEITPNFIGANPCPSFPNAFVSIQEITMAASNDSMRFWVGLNLVGLPEYVTEQTYLDSNLCLSMDKGISKILYITNKPPKELAKDDKSVALNCTHYVLIRVTEIDDCVSTLSLSLKYSIPEWVISLNEPGDENNREKTFGLEKMISGFEQAYDAEKKGYFFKKLNIALLKK